MKELEEKILKEGKVLPGNVLKVGSFLNHTLDTKLIMNMGKEIARLFSDTEIDKILTIETSGIPIAFAAGFCMDKPVVFAKKSKTSNISSECYSASIHSYTHNNDYQAVVSKDFLKKGEKVLLVDDFLANGQALIGLMEIVKSASAQTVGAAVAIEKCFQSGGKILRDGGLRVESLAMVESMNDESLTFKNQ